MKIEIHTVDGSSEIDFVTVDAGNGGDSLNLLGLLLNLSPPAFASGAMDELSPPAFASGAMDEPCVTGNSHCPISEVALFFREAEEALGDPSRQTCLKIAKALEGFAYGYNSPTSSSGKIRFIKAIREITGAGLREVKGLTDRIGPFKK